MPHVRLIYTIQIIPGPTLFPGEQGKHLQPDIMKLLSVALMCFNRKAGIYKSFFFFKETISLNHRNQEYDAEQ